MGFRTSPHPSTPQSPMMSPSPSPLHSPGPGVGPMQLQQSPISPHSRQPSPRMGTPHSQVLSIINIIFKCFHLILTPHFFSKFENQGWWG